MGIPILTSEGFVGQRWIIDDYFQAGETLHCGDVVVIRGTTPRVHKATSAHVGRVIGIVHTPAAKAVGDQAATSGNYVPIVVKGIAQALSSGSIEVGDPVMASGTRGTPSGKTASVARVVGSATHNHSPNTPADDKTGVGGSHTHTISEDSEDSSTPSESQ